MFTLSLQIWSNNGSWSTKEGHVFFADRNCHVILTFVSLVTQGKKRHSLFNNLTNVLVKQPSFVCDQHYQTNYGKGVMYDMYRNSTLQLMFGNSIDFMFPFLYF